MQDDVEIKLKKSGLKVTRPRVLILSLLMEEHGPFNADEIYKKLPSDSCDQATVFRALKQFVQKKLILSLAIDDSCTHYEYNCDTHHHHVVCRKCSKIETLKRCNISDLYDEARGLGHIDLDHRLEIFGICKLCQ